MKVRLDSTVALTAACPPGKKKIVLWDETVSGFVLEVRESGSRTYALRYIDARGVQRQVKIARGEDLSFAEAKKKAVKLRSEVVLGGDPAGDKRERRAIPTYASIAEQHLAHARTYQRSYDSTEMVMRRHVLPRWGKLRLDEIVPRDIARWLAEKAGEGLKPATVEKIRVVFSRSFSLAQQWEVPGAETNPVQRVPRARFNNARERYLSAEEASRLLAACDRSLNPQLGNIVRLLLLTGARVGELLRAEWRHVSVDRKAWLIPTSKTGKPRHVPLSQAALDVIAGLPTFDGCPFLLPNPDTKRPFVSIKRAWQTARKEARLSDLHVHDLRHSAASFMINAGIDLYAVGRILGHSDHASTQRYSHLANATLLAAVEAGAANMAQLR